MALSCRGRWQRIAALRLVLESDNAPGSPPPRRPRSSPPSSPAARSARSWPSSSTRPGPARPAPASPLASSGRTPCMADIPEVLFVCTHNAGRSQMAAALLDHQAAGRARVSSAGSQPADQLNPAVVAAMAEIGLDISREYPKPLTTGNVQAADVVITMGCGDACPIYPGKRYEDWDLPDPAGLGLAAVRPIRDEINRRVGQLLAELVATHS